MVLMNLSAGQGWRYRCKGQTCGHSRGWRGWGRWREQHWNRYTTMCRMDSWWEASVSTGCSAQCPEIT